MNNENYLLICVGFIGKLATSSNIKFKIKVNNVSEVMGNKRIKLIKSININSEEYAGLKWNLKIFNEKKVLRPQSYLMYTNTNGETLKRFTNYNYTMQRKIDEETEKNQNSWI